MKKLNSILVTEHGGINPNSFGKTEMVMEINEQIRIIESQIHSKEANFTLLEKMQYLTRVFGSDPEYSTRAMDIVHSNICRNTKDEDLK